MSCEKKIEKKEEKNPPGAIWPLMLSGNMLP
jgi:hypothetical protein